MKKGLLIIFTLLSVFYTTENLAQRTFVNYERDGGWNLGINMGATWQEKEEFLQTGKYSRPFAGFAGGLTLGKAIYEKPGSFLAFDFRGRALFGSNYGWVGVPVQDSIVTTIVPGVDSLDRAFGFRNYRMTLAEFSLEGVITLHRLRERTGIILYGFGGIGGTLNTISEDRYDEFSGSLVNNTGIDTNQSARNIANDLRFDSDLDFESTLADTRWSLVPSLGFGLGYQISPGVSIGFEHKIGYDILNSEFDGGNMTGLNDARMDRYHYTGFNLRINFLKPRPSFTPNNTTDHNNYTTPTTPTTPVTPTEPTGNRPLVNIYNPNTNNLVVNNALYTIKAKVYHITNINGISFKQNGIPNNQFNYNPNTNEFVAQVSLYPGNNSFQIEGTNTYGSDQDSRVIILEQNFTTAPAPIVTFTSPAVPGTTTGNNTHTVTATVLNVASKANIKFNHNGVNINNFSYNISSKVLVANVSLSNGTNTFTITAVNNTGSDTKTTSLIYQQEVVDPRPEVIITTPSTNPYNTTSPTEIVNGLVKHVNSNNDIEVLVNGATYTNFSYNNATDKISFTPNLIFGANFIQIKGTNAQGSASASTTIVYKPSEVVAPPVVDFVNPSTNPFNTTVGNINIQATVLNVNNKSGIKVKFNGVNVPVFGFNTVTKMVTFNTNLITGNNIVEITGTNSNGSDTEQTVIRYKQMDNVVPPIVDITNPATSPYTTNSNTQVINATVLNVSNSSGVSAKLNGAAVSGFTFDPNTKKFMYNATLINGANIFEITGSNSAGTATKNTTIIYVPQEVPCESPSITLSQPNGAGGKIRTIGASSHITINTQNSKGAIVGIIANVTKPQIQFRINGVNSPGFNFDAATGKFESFLNLTEGANMYEIIATNDCGSVSESITFIYEPEIKCEDPVIQIINPQKSSLSFIGNPNYTITASIYNVTNANLVSFTNNNNPIPFSFNANTGDLTASVPLSVGSNEIKISARNECGTIAQQVNISYSEPVSPPEVTIATPSPLPYNTVDGDFTVTGHISNIDTKSQVNILIDGTALNAFTFDVTSGKYSFPVSLPIGSHIITITGTNTAGQDSKTANITVELDGDPPSVEFVNISNGTSAANPKVVQAQHYEVIGNVINHQGATVIFKVDGTPVNLFMYNANSGSFNVPVSFSGTDGELKTLEVIATNQIGSGVKIGHLRFGTATGQGSSSDGGNTNDAGNNSGNGGNNDGANNNNSSVIQAPIPTDPKEKAYNGYITDGDAAMNANKFDEAYGLYNKASQLKPSEQYPRSKMNEIKVVKQKMQDDINYQNEMKKANIYFKAGKYSTAKIHYQKALSYKPNDSTAKSKISQCINKMKIVKPGTDFKPTGGKVIKTPNSSGSKNSNSGDNSKTTTPTNSGSKVVKPSFTKPKVVTPKTESEQSKTKEEETKKSKVKVSPRAGGGK